MKSRQYLALASFLTLTLMFSVPLWAKTEAVSEDVPAYGWWYSKSSRMRGVGHPGGNPGRGPMTSDGQAGAKPEEATASGGHPGGKPEGAASSGGHPGGSSDMPAAAEGLQKTADVKSTPPANMPASHSFASNRSPVQSLYLGVKGASMPESAPEVYYRFTARTMERHGGVALGSSIHQAKVERDGDSWRADFIGNTFGTVEVYSRFRLADNWVYSQHNYLHFIRAEDAEGVEMPHRAELPADWPKIVFPTSSYNDMPFRGTQAGQQVEFEIDSAKSSGAPDKAVAVENEIVASPVALTFNKMSGKFGYRPQEDEAMKEAGARATKKSVILALIPGTKSLVTFSMDISRSRWSTRKLGWGSILIFSVAAVTIVTVLIRRKRFRYNDFN